MIEPKVTVNISKDLHFQMKLAAVHEFTHVSKWLEEAIKDKLSKVK
jgi:hypothetical protein